MFIDQSSLPCLTADIPGIGGSIKSCPDDFIVEEVPLYEPSGEGTHVYFRIEKRGMPTTQAIQRIARALGVRPFEIGYAGLKDAEAITTQTLSVEHIDPATVAALDLADIRVVSVSRHRNKLKLGHLAGNRFLLKVRRVDPARLADARTMLDILARRGVPNYFGNQRFGMRGDNWQVGRAILLGDFSEAMALMLGRPGPCDYDRVIQARQLYDRGEYEAAAQAWPYSFNNERRLCRAMVQSKGNHARAFRALDRRQREFLISALQSYLFNQVAARRIGSLDRLLPGDLAWRHPQGAVFRVEDIAVEQPRCDVFEISPTGPLFGQRMTAPTGDPGEIEQAVLNESGIVPERWQNSPEYRVNGSRRPLRFRPHEASAEAGRDEHGDYLELRFRLESGCYATTVLRELCKSDPTAGAESDP